MRCKRTINQLGWIGYVVLRAGRGGWLPKPYCRVANPDLGSITTPSRWLTLKDDNKACDWVESRY